MRGISWIGEKLLAFQEEINSTVLFNPLNAELNPTCHLLSLLAAHHILHVSKTRVKGHFNHLNAEFNPTYHLLALLGANHIFHVSRLTFWCHNYFFLILAHPVYKMWIKQEPNMLELWNKLHFEERKKRRVYTVFKIFSTYICWINI